MNNGQPLVWLRYALICLFAVALSGCYETTKPIFDRGDKIPMFGQYHCSTAKTNAYVRFEETLRNKKGGHSDYRYRIFRDVPEKKLEPIDITFARIDKRMYAAQLGPPVRLKYTYFSFEFIPKGELVHIRGYIYNRPTDKERWSQKSDLYKIDGIELLASLFGTPHLSGDKAAIRSFLLKKKNYQLAKGEIICRR